MHMRMHAYEEEDTFRKGIVQVFIPQSTATVAWWCEWRESGEGVRRVCVSGREREREIESSAKCIAIGRLIDCI